MHACMHACISEAIGVLIRGSSDLYDRTCNAELRSATNCAVQADVFTFSWKSIVKCCEVMSGLTELNAIQDTSCSQVIEESWGSLEAY